MKQLVSYLLMLSLSTAMGVSVFAQQSSLEGAWVLDSVQVKETMPDNIIEKTVLPNEQALFNANWMKQFKLDTNGKVSYTEVGFKELDDEQSYAITGVPYEIKDIVENTATLIINSITDRKILKIKMVSDNTMMIEQSFTSGYNMRNIEISWKKYYHRRAE